MQSYPHPWYSFGRSPDRPRCVLGKKPARRDPRGRTLSLAKYLTKIPMPPNAVGWQNGVPSWPMMLNDSLGDCTCAAAGHMEMAWTWHESASMVTPTDAQVEAMYEAVGGYVPGQPDTDNGADELTVLNYWRQTGLAGRKISMFGAVNPALLDDLKAAIWVFGGAYIGLQMPNTAQNQSFAWSVPGSLQGDGAPGSWGGHAVPILGYETLASGKLIYYVVSWGQVFRMTQYFLQCYCDEAYGIIAPDFFAKGDNPLGVDVAQAQADLKAVTES